MLNWALPGGTPRADSVELEMRGELWVGRWRPFSAEQVIVAGRRFRSDAVLGGRLLRLSGADEYGLRAAGVDFRLHGLVPVARSTGPDVARSAAGRLAAQTVAWLPRALTPQAGAVWSDVDDSCAEVALDVNGAWSMVADDVCAIRCDGPPARHVGVTAAGDTGRFGVQVSGSRARS